MRLRALIPADQIVAVVGSLDVEVARIVTDSRQVAGGDVFVCLPGYRSEGGETRADRHEFIPVAIERGAAALVVARDVALQHVSTVRVRDPWAVVAAMAARYHGHPSRALELVGVTGTSGKTSTTYCIESVLAAAGRRTARLGTIEYQLGERTLPAAQTTPEAPMLQGLLRTAVDAGCTAAVMEVSSHALELGRVAAIDFDVGVFTNLSHDHLNFHPDMQHYRRAKGRLFEGLGGGDKRRGIAVVNVDDPASEYMIGANRGTLLTYGVEAGADVSATDVRMDLRGVRFTATTPRGRRAVALRHLGEYSVYNALAALATGEALGLELDATVAGLAATPPVPGRFELVDAGQDFVVAVDYAHKPDALRRLLESARRLRPRRLVTVFGCGGDRDRAKRPVMGRIAAELGDYAIVTSDNPRSEEPQAIVDAILAGVREIDPRGARHIAVVDRAEAIAHAIDTAGPGDIVLIAGKGHETYQLIGGQRLDFDDREVARRALVAASRVRFRAPSDG